MSDDLEPFISATKVYESANRHGLVIGLILSVFFGFYLWWLTWEVRELSYSVRNNRSILFDSENPLGFRLLLKEPIEIKDQDGDITEQLKDLPTDKNVYSAQVIIWNSGNLPIKPENVLDFVGFRVGLDEVVLDVRVTDASRSDITQFRPLLIGACAEVDDQGHVVQKSCDIGLDWKILEPKDYAIVQLVYSGDKNAEIVLDGAIEGKLPIKLAAYQDGGKLSNYFQMFFSSIAILWLIAMTAAKLSKPNFIKNGLQQSPLYFRWLLLVTCGGLTVLVIYFAYKWWELWNSAPINF